MARLRASIRLRAVRDGIRTSFWFVPSVMMAAAAHRLKSLRHRPPIDGCVAPHHLAAMTGANAFLLAASTAIFVGAASSAKTWALSANSYLWLAVTLVLYTLGNLIMLRLIRDVGMGVALSLSAVVQLVAVNLVALAVFQERVSTVQAAGLVLAVIAVTMITLAPAQR